MITREFAPVCTSPKWLTEDPVLPSTIRHHNVKSQPLFGWDFFCPFPL